MKETFIVNSKKVKCEVYIGRPSKWGNPFTHNKGESLALYKTKTRKEAVDNYKLWITEGEGKHLLEDLHELRGKILGCWCKPKLCHGDILIELINEKFEEKSKNLLDF